MKDLGRVQRVTEMLADAPPPATELAVVHFALLVSSNTAAFFHRE